MKPNERTDKEQNEVDRKTELTLRPRVDIRETEGAFLIDAEMPGAGREDVDVRLEDGELQILGRARHEHPAGYEHEQVEYRLHNYERAFRLPDTVDFEKIEATMKNGVLRLRLPKREAAKPKAIKVKVA